MKYEHLTFHSNPVRRIKFSNQLRKRLLYDISHKSFTFNGKKQTKKGNLRSGNIFPKLISMIPCQNVFILKQLEYFIITIYICKHFDTPSSLAMAKRSWNFNGKVLFSEVESLKGKERMQCIIILYKKNRPWNRKITNTLTLMMQGWDLIFSSSIFTVGGWKLNLHEGKLYALLCWQETTSLSMEMWTHQR